MTKTAFNRYEQTWNRFIKELETNPKITLCTVCKTMHTDYGLMREWASWIGHSVIKEKSSRRKNKIKETTPSAFAVLVPRENPPVHNETCLIGISIFFSSGTTINIKQADADSVIRLVSLHERKDGDPCIL